MYGAFIGCRCLPYNRLQNIYFTKLFLKTLYELDSIEINSMYYTTFDIDKYCIEYDNDDYKGSKIEII